MNVVLRKKKQVKLESILLSVLSHEFAIPQSFSFLLLHHAVNE
jgi:hypothetical protein